MEKLKIISWNVNGIRSCQKKGFINWLNNEKPDILCVQETKADPIQLDSELIDLENYHSYYAKSQRKGHFGVATFLKKIKTSNSLHQCKTTEGIGVEEFDREGRTLIHEFEKFILFNCYFPNGGRDHSRVDFKLKYSNKILTYAKKLKQTSQKSILIAGDFNTAHTEKDLSNPKGNINTSGFLPEERKFLDKMHSEGIVDSFRQLHPKLENQYTWWTYRNNCRTRNIGWRLDMIYIDLPSVPLIESAFILPEVQGSDHCPVGIEFKVLRDSSL